MHEVAELDEADFEGRGSRARRSYYGLLGWNAVHILIAVAAAGVAAGTTHWIDTSPPGLLGINNAGLWSVCYTDVPDDETVDDLTRHLSDIVAANLFGSEGTSSNFNKQLEAELLEQDGYGVFEEELRDLIASGENATNATDATANGVSSDEDQKFVDELADGELTPDMIPASVKESKDYKSALQKASVNVLVGAAVEGFPVSSGCTNPVNIYKNDSAGEFFRAVPYPNGPNSYYLFQCLRGFVSGFGIFGLLACVIFFGSLGVRVGGCSLSNIFFGTLFGTLQVLCGLAGVISYFILLARISGSDSSQVLNVSYMFVSQPISFGVHQYWGWSAWVFIGATGWSLLMFPFTCCMLASHRVSRAEASGDDDDRAYGLAAYGLAHHPDDGLDTYGQGEKDVELTSGADNNGAAT